jgi:hypothetical protein
MELGQFTCTLLEPYRTRTTYSRNWTAVHPEKDWAAIPLKLNTVDIRTIQPNNQNWTTVQSKLEQHTVGTSLPELYQSEVLFTIAKAKEVLYCSRNNTYHAAKVEPLYGAVLIITANHLAVGNLHNTTKIVTFPKKKIIFF